MMHVEDILSTTGGAEYHGVSQKRLLRFKGFVSQNITALFCPSPFSLVLS